MVNLGYVLDFPSGKTWVAEQLESIGQRYLNRHAKLMAQKVRETMLEDLNLFRSESPMQAENKFVLPEPWDSSAQQSQRDLYQALLVEDEKRRVAAAVQTHDAGTFHDDYGGWNTRLQ